MCIKRTFLLKYTGTGLSWRAHGLFTRPGMRAYRCSEFRGYRVHAANMINLSSQMRVSVPATAGQRQGWTGGMPASNVCV